METNASRIFPHLHKYDCLQKGMRVKGKLLDFRQIAISSLRQVNNPSLPPFLSHVLFHGYLSFVKR